MLLLKEVEKVKKALLDVKENVLKENTFKDNNKSNNKYINRNHSKSSNGNKIVQLIIPL